jgi:hypothetical protein
LSEYTLKLAVDAFKMSLKISLSGSDKVVVVFEAFGGEGGSATDGSVN